MTVSLSMHATLTSLPGVGLATNPREHYCKCVGQYRWYEIRVDRWAMAAIKWAVTVHTANTDSIGADVLANLSASATVHRRDGHALLFTTQPDPI